MRTEEELWSSRLEQNCAPVDVDSAKGRATNNDQPRLGNINLRLGGFSLVAVCCKLHISLSSLTCSCWGSPRYFQPNRSHSNAAHHFCSHFDMLELYGLGQCRKKNILCTRIRTHPSRAAKPRSAEVRHLDTLQLYFTSPIESRFPNINRSGRTGHMVSS